MQACVPSSTAEDLRTKWRQQLLPYSQADSALQCICTVALAHIEQAEHPVKLHVGSKSVPVHSANIMTAACPVYIADCLLPLVWCADSKQGTRDWHASLLVIMGMRQAIGGAASGTRDPTQEGNLLESGSVCPLTLHGNSAAASVLRQQRSVLFLHTCSCMHVCVLERWEIGWLHIAWLWLWHLCTRVRILKFHSSAVIVNGTLSTSAKLPQATCQCPNACDYG